MQETKVENRNVESLPPPEEPDLNADMAQIRGSAAPETDNVMQQPHEAPLQPGDSGDNSGESQDAAWKDLSADSQRLQELRQEYLKSEQDDL